MKGLQPGFQLQPLRTSSSQGGTNLTETELGSTLVGAKQPPPASLKGSKAKSSQGTCQCPSFEAGQQSDVGSRGTAHRALFALVPPSSTPWEPIVKQEGSLPRIYTGEI